MTMSSVPTNPGHGVSWHLVWGLLDPVELSCGREIFTQLLSNLVLDIFKLIMVTIYFVFSQHTCFIQITMNCVKKCQLTLISLDGTTVQLTPTPMCQLTPMTFVYFMLLLQKAETTMTNHFSLTLQPSREVSHTKKLAIIIIYRQL